MIWFLIVLFVALALPFGLEAMRPPIAPRQKQAEGQIAKLPGGRTHYRWIGPSRGPVIVAIHGLTTPSPVWDQLAEELAEIGYRTLVYDLWGRGLSDALVAKHDRKLYLAQLSDLLEAEGVAEDITLMGYSMGGSIATAYAATHPDKIKRLILLAPGGIEMRESAFSAFCRRVPVIGDSLFLLLAPARMRAQILMDRNAPQLAEVQKAELARRGFFPAVLSSRRHMLAEVQQEEHQALSRMDVPTLAIWGGQDDVIPISALGRLTQWNRHVKQEVVEDAGHALPYSHPDDTASYIIEMLREG